MNTKKNILWFLLVSTFVLVFQNGVCYSKNILRYKDFTISNRSLSWQERIDKDVVKQDTDFSCGAASLATILKFFYNLEEIDEEYVLKSIFKNGVKREALTFQNMKKFSESIGFRVKAIAIPPEALSKLKLPVILFQMFRDNGHFTVYKGQNKMFVFLADPTYGNYKMPWSRFLETWKTRNNSKYPGKVMVLLPPSKFSPKNHHFFLGNEEKPKNFIAEVLKTKLIH